MIIGFDYYKTLTRHPKLIAMFVQALQSAGHEVVLISAVNAKESQQSYRNRILRECKAWNVNFHRVEVVPFIRDEQNPEVKLKACQRLGVEAMFDDRADVCALLVANGIPVFQVILE